MVGAAIITLLLAVMAFATRQIVRLVSGSVQFPYPVSLIPVVLCGALHSNYGHRLSVTLSLVIVLLAITFYIALASRFDSWRWLHFPAITVLVYYLTGGAALLFAFVCLAFEVVPR